MKTIFILCIVSGTELYGWGPFNANKPDCPWRCWSTPSAVPRLAGHPTPPGLLAMDHSDHQTVYHDSANPQSRKPRLWSSPQRQSKLGASPRTTTSGLPGLHPPRHGSPPGQRPICRSGHLGNTVRICRWEAAQAEGHRLKMGKPGWGNPGFPREDITENHLAPLEYRHPRPFA